MTLRLIEMIFRLSYLIQSFIRIKISCLKTMRFGGEYVRNRFTCLSEFVIKFISLKK